MKVDDLALKDFFSVAYEELRGVAARVRRNDPSSTLNPTALVNEAFLKLAESLRMTPESKLHFRRIAARAMRQVLVDAARKRMSDKRGAAFQIVQFDDEVTGVQADAVEVVALDSALEQLARMSPRQALIVEYRFFGGFEFEEIAQLMGISRSTVMREWKVAKDWLALQVRQPG